MARAPVHIGIDGRELVGQPTGVGRYLSSVMRVWLKATNPDHRFTVFLPSEPPADLRALGSAVDWTVLPSSSPGTWWEQTTLASAATKAGVDVLFAPAYTAPLRFRGPIVLTIHDLSYFAHPEWFSLREGFRRRFLTRASASRAAMVLTPSAFAAREVVTRLGLDGSRVRAILSGAPAVQAPAAPATSPTVLYVGSIFNRRHVPELMKAFAAARTRVPDARLVLVGDNRTTPVFDLLAAARDLGIGDAVDWRRYAPDADLDRLYGSSHVFAFLSEYEGFALTPMEAMAHHLPVVLLDTPIAREIYGDSARLVPLDVSTIASALVDLLCDTSARTAAAARGLARLSDYSWSRTAAQVLEALDQAARR